MTLYVFALNTRVSVTLTDLTRAQGLSAGLPPLADWLGLEHLDTDRVELFAVKDLGDLSLSQYLAQAYDANVADQGARIDALEGSVLLVPARAMTGMPNPGPEATLIAVLDTAEPDHRARLNPASVPDQKAPEPVATPQPPPARPKGWIIALALGLAVLLVWWLL